MNTSDELPGDLPSPESFTRVEEAWEALYDLERRLVELSRPSSDPKKGGRTKAGREPLNAAQAWSRLAGYRRALSTLEAEQGGIHTGTPVVVNVLPEEPPVVMESEPEDAGLRRLGAPTLPFEAGGGDNVALEIPNPEPAPDEPPTAEESRKTGSSLTPEQREARRRGGLTRAGQFTPESQAAAGKALAEKKGRAHMQAIGRNGYQKAVNKHPDLPTKAGEASWRKQNLCALLRGEFPNQSPAGWGYTELEVQRLRELEKDKDKGLLSR